MIYFFKGPRGHCIIFIIPYAALLVISGVCWDDLFAPLGQLKISCNLRLHMICCVIWSQLNIISSNKILPGGSPPPMDFYKSSNLSDFIAIILISTLHFHTIYYDLYCSWTLLFVNFIVHELYCLWTLLFVNFIVRDNLEQLSNHIFS